MVRAAWILAAACALPVIGCSSMYYSAMESFGVEKRHIMVDRVEEARDSQEEAKEQFQTTLQRFKDLTGADGGELEDVYEDLAAEYERSEAQAEDVRERIDSIEDVAEDMFAEWESEIEEIQDAGMRSEDRAILSETRGRYAELIAAMRRAEEKMNPVLQTFKDRVLYLKHHLNAKMVAQLQGNLTEIESNVDALIADMEASIAEANEFIQNMGEES